MGKHSIEKEDKKISKRVIYIIIICIITILLITSILTIYNKDVFKLDKSVINSKTVEGEKLVLKSKLDYNRIIEYTFENSILKTIKIYEKFKEKEQYEEKKKTYSLIDDIILLKADDEDLSIETEKKKLGEDEGLSYDEIYNKYLNQFIDIYTIIE